jgi:hypothetical protein
MPTLVATTSGAPVSAAAFALTLPSHSAGDLLLCVVSGKDNTVGTLTINQGWTSAGQFTGGTGTNAADTGTVFMAVFYKIAASGTETAPTVTPGSPAPNTWTWMCRSFAPSSGATMVAPQASFASDTVTGTTGLTGTPAAFSPAVDGASTIVQAAGVIPTDTGSANSVAEAILTVPGFTGGTVTVNTTDFVETSLGTDTAMLWSHLSGATGTSTGAPTVTFGVTAGNNDSGGVLAIAVTDTIVGPVPGVATASLGFTATATGGVAVTPALVSRIVGPNGIVRTRTTGATSVRLKIGTNSAVTTSVTYSSTVNPDGDGYADHDIAGLGLTAGQQYFYRVELTNAASTVSLDADATVGQFRVPPAGPTSFGFSFGSCSDFTYLTGGATDSDALARVAEQGDDLFFHLGDLFYADGEAQTEANYRTWMDSRITALNHAAILATRVSNYTPSDHDFGFGNDTNGTEDPTAAVAFNAVYRERWPAPVPADGVYYAFTWGRVRFIQLDGRTFKSNNGATDNSGKRVLGLTQQTWFLDQIAAATEPLIVVAQDIPPIGAAEASDDSWTGYTANRATIAAAIAAANKNVILLAGDAHTAYFDDGTSPNGFDLPVLAASPFLAPRSVKGGPFTVGPLPASGSPLQQYGHVDITDDGVTITVDFEARRSDGAVLISEQLVYAPTAGVAAASLGFTATAAGRPRALGAAVASLGGAFTASGVARRLGQAAASLGFTATASGQTDAPPATGAATASLGFAAVATGIRRVRAAAAAALGFTAAASGPSASASPTPPDRTLVVPAESRTLVVPPENRTLEA